MFRTTAFHRLENIYIEKCKIHGWEVPAPILSSKGLLFARAFKIHAIVTLLNGKTRPLGASVKVVSHVDASGKQRCGLGPLPR